jgi:predicted acylesterase/phospholipase RssA
MPYNIEFIAIGADIYADLNRAAAALNGIQNQFRFDPPRGIRRVEGIDFKRDVFSTTEIWTFLRDQRMRIGGHRPHIIAFVTRPLRSSKYFNILGSHEGAEGLAVVTTSDAAQYVKEITRYLCYYLVRYSLSFINPHIKAHEDETRKNCYFHFKRLKLEIRESMDSGHICDHCRTRLDNPPADDRTAHRLSAEEREAIHKMLAYVSGALPYALVMKGGGVKGLAFAGALLELEKHYWFDRHVGTSAGAIAATLLAASYTPRELTALLLDKSFRDFMDAPWWKIPFNLLRSQGCFPGEACRLWIADLLTTKVGQLSEVPMSALNGALVYAARQGSGTLTFDSLGERRDTVASFAVRCSMSIPFFFSPVTVDGRRVFDGGLRNNFPLTRFLAQEPRSNFIALYLGRPDNTNRRGAIIGDLLNIAIEGEERKTVDSYPDNVIVIDTSPIGTIDFNLTAIEKEFLLRIGAAAALKFLRLRKLDDGPTQEDVLCAQDKADTCRQIVIQMRNKRSRRYVLFVACIIAIAIAIYLPLR